MSGGARAVTADGCLTWRGVIESVGGRRCVALEANRCNGCSGGCGLAQFAPPRLFLHADVGASNGTSVEVVAAAHRLAWRALLVFGTPLAVALAASLVVETMAWPSWLIVVALLGTIVALAGARRAWRHAEHAPVIERDSEIVRIRID